MLYLLYPKTHKLTALRIFVATIKNNNTKVTLSFPIVFSYLAKFLKKQRATFHFALKYMNICLFYNSFAV